MTDEYQEMWNAIQASPFMSIYISELYWLAKQIEAETDRVFEDTPPPAKRGQGYIRVDRELHSRITNVLIGAARVRAFISTRTRDGSRGQKEILQRRAEGLRDLLDGIDLDPILDSKARNSIEHFDEYIDTVAIQSYRGAIDRPSLFAVDMVLSTRHLLDNLGRQSNTRTTYLIRAYISDERVFSNCGRELKLQPLHDCAKAIRIRMEPLLPTDITQERGASMFVVTDSTFSVAG